MLLDNKGLVNDCLMKLDKVTDDTWEDILDRYELDYSQDHLRKMAYGMRIMRDTMEDFNEDEVLLELKKEKVKLADLKNSVNRNIRQLARVENMIELIINECNNISNFKLVDVNTVKPYKDGHKALCLISDIHYDGTDKPINNFNKVIDYTIDKCRLHQINQLNVMIAGDIINNQLHNTIRIENREDVSKQIVNVSKLISDGLYKLAKHIPMITVALVVGNHERSVEKYKNALTTDTYLPVIKELIELRVDDIHNIVILPNAEVDGEIDDRFCVMNFDGKTHVVAHGDSIKNPDKNAIRTVEGYLGNSIRIDYLYLGHFHSEKSFQTYEANVVINGALYNGSDYGKKLLLRTPEVQKLMILNNGDIECTYNIRLG